MHQTDAKWFPLKNQINITAEWWDIIKEITIEYKWLSIKDWFTCVIDFFLNFSQAKVCTKRIPLLKDPLLGYVQQ